MTGLPWSHEGPLAPASSDVVILSSSQTPSDWDARLLRFEQDLRKSKVRGWIVEIAALVAALVATTAGVVFLVKRLTPFWLPLDTSRYVAEVEWIRGARDILPTIHPPAFPLTLYGFDLVTNQWDAALLATAFAYSWYLLATYVLIRQHRPAVIASIATLSAAPMPLLAEIIGWGGGSNLMGAGAAILALALTERWVRCHRGSIWVGLAIGFAFAAHPLGGTLAVAFVGLRGVIEFAQVRRWRWRGRGTDSLLAWLLVPVASVPFVLASSYYYFGLSSPEQVRLGVPDLTVLMELMEWAGREHPLILAVQFSAVVAPFFFRRSPAGPAAVTIASVVVLGVTGIKGDPSYQSRFMYLVPVLVALLVAETIIPGLKLLAKRARRAPSRPGLTIATAVVVMTLFQVGFHTRLSTAVEYYERARLDDIELLQSLKTGSGTVAASHWASSTSEPTNWFVNAAAVRNSWSPIGPWLSTVEEEAEAGQTLQRFFAGQVILENSAVQVAASATEQGYYSLEIAVRHNGWFFPMLRLDAARTRWPVPVTSAKVELNTTQQIELTLSGPNPDEDILVRAELSSQTVTLTASTGAIGNEQWHIVLSPSPEASWTTIRSGPGSVESRQLVDGRAIVATISGSSADSLTRASVYSAGDPVDFDTVATDQVTISWQGGQGLQQAGETNAFKEAGLGASLDITEVVVWRNTGLVERFRTECFSEIGSSGRIVIFRVLPACRVDGAG